MDTFRTPTATQLLQLGQTELLSKFHNVQPVVNIGAGSTMRGGTNALVLGLTVIAVKGLIQFASKKFK